MAAKKPRMLKAGEVILPTDQVLIGPPISKWLCGLLNCGEKLPAKYEGLYCRLNTKETGRTVRAKHPAQQCKVKEGNYMKVHKRSCYKTPCGRHMETTCGSPTKIKTSYRWSDVTCKVCLKSRPPKD